MKSSLLLTYYQPIRLEISSKLTSYLILRVSGLLFPRRRGKNRTKKERKEVEPCRSKSITHSNNHDSPPFSLEFILRRSRRTKKMRIKMNTGTEIKPAKFTKERIII
jgi:hypothetical protein